MDPTENEFGMSFIHAREALGLSRREVAEELNLAWKIIEDLEDGNLKGLPPYVFVRGYVKSYSKFLEIDSDEMVSRLAVVYKDKIKADNPRDNSGTRKKFLSRLTRMSLRPVLIFSIPIIIVVVYLFFYFSLAERLESEVINKPLIIESPSEIIVDEIVGNQRRKINGEDLGEDADQESRVPEDDYPEDTIFIENLENELEKLEGRDKFVSKKQTLEGLSDIGLLVTDIIEMEFNDDCWYEISTEDGKLLTSDLGRSGETKNVRGAGPFKVKLGYAPGVVVRYNDETIELSSFTRNNIAVFKLGRKSNVGQ